MLDVGTVIFNRADGGSGRESSLEGEEGKREKERKQKRNVALR